MVQKYENWNENKGLWSFIEQALQKISNTFDIKWNEDSFKNFFLTKNCFSEYNNNALSSFCIKGTFSIIKNIKYLEDRNGANRKRWEKEKQNIENTFKIFFPDFNLPEKSYKPVLNPLMNQNSQATLQMEDLKSKKFSDSELEKILGIEGNEFSNLVSFILSVDSKDTTLKNPVRTGINEIEDNNEAEIYINVDIFISLPIDYCLQVINSKSLSEILIYNYISLQLSAYQGYNNYPNKVVNAMQAPTYFFDIEKPMGSPFLVSYPDGQIYYIQKSNLLYETYIQETKKLYNPTKKELIGELFNLDSIKNKVIKFDLITKQYIYTDGFGSIQRLDLSGSETISQKRIDIIKNFKTDSDIIQRFFQVLDSIYSKLEISNKINFNEVSKELENCSIFKDITLESCPRTFQILNDCYNNWDQINFDIILKSKFKIYLNILLFEKSNIEEQNNVPMELKISNLTRSHILPVELVRTMKYCYKNELINFDSKFRNIYFINKISVLLNNNKIKKSAIVTFDTLEVYNTLQVLSQGSFNGIILDSETIRKLYTQFGDNLITYFQTVPVNTIFIIHPNVFFDSSIFGDTDLYLANKLSFRPLILEVLKAIQLEYIIYFKELQLNSTDFLALSLRSLFADIKYRTIFGEIDYKDMLILDPNSSVDSILSSNELKEDLKISEQEAKNFGNIFVAKDSFLSYIPEIKLNTYVIDTPKIQSSYYMELVNAYYDKMINDKDFKQSTIFSDLNNFSEVASLVSNFLSLPDIFLNSPNNSMFIFKEKFEQEDNPNLYSEKLEILYNILSSHLYGGVVDGVRKNAKTSSILVVCENRVVRDHLYKNLENRFYGNLCYKFKSGSLDELTVFRNKRIGFITKDLLDNNLVFKNVTNYIIVQNSWQSNYLETLFNDITYNALNCNIKEDLEINFVLFNNSLELNKYLFNISSYVLAEYKNTLNNGFDSKILDNISDKVLDFNKLDVLNWDKLKLLDLQGKIEQILNKKLVYSNTIQENLLVALSNKLGIKFSKEDLFDINFSYLNNNSLDLGGTCYVPFINNIYLDFYSLLDMEIDEKFSDLNGNNYLYQNGKVQLNMPVFTEYGSGYISEESGDNYIVKVINAKEFVVPKNLIFKMQMPESEKYLEYIKSISTSGDSKIDLNLLQETTLKKKDEDIDLDIKDNSISLSVDRINGLFSIYTSLVDSDNIRLENFDFNHYTNIFIIEPTDDISDIVRLLKLKQFDEKYLTVLQEAFKQWKNGKEFLLAPSFDYFSCEQVNAEFPRAYAMIWNKKFYVLINGNFYSKVGYKLSRKFKVSLIKNLYIQGFKSLKDCKYELIKVSKTLNIINLQQLLEFFDQDFLTLDYLKVSEHKEDKAENEQNNSLLRILKTKEEKLKKHIKDLRRNKYGQ